MKRKNSFLKENTQLDKFGILKYLHMQKSQQFKAKCAYFTAKKCQKMLL